MRLNVGRIGRAHGILGEATVEVRTDEPQLRFAPGAKLLTDNGELIVASSRLHNGIWLLAFEGVTDRNQIEMLRDTLLYADVDINRPGQSEDDFHIQQLIGLRVELSDGSSYGQIKEVINLPGQDCLVIATSNGESLIPFVKQLVPIVDLASGKVVVIPPVIS